MCRITSLFFLQSLKGCMSDEACNFNNMETRAANKFLFLQGNVPEEIHTILTETLVGTCTIVCHHQKMGAQD